jgi:hypothetical protein
MKPFTTVAIFVFSVVSLLQLIRAALAWELTVDGIFIPIWASIIACVVAGILAIMVWREART